MVVVIVAVVVHDCGPGMSFSGFAFCCSKMFGFAKNEDIAVAVI